MPFHRKLILILAILVTGGSIGSTAYYAHHLGSDAHLLETEKELTEFFDLPTKVGAIRGRTFSSRAFENIVLYLPERHEKVFECKTAIWETLSSGGNESRRLGLEDGKLILGSEGWHRAEYNRILASSLGHDFESLDLETVTLKDFEVSFERGGLTIRCRKTSGTIEMGESDRGIARLQAYELNGYSVHEGVRIQAQFAPHDGVKISELDLTLPEIPLSVTGLGNALGGNITTGKFAGKVHIKQPSEPENREAVIRGELIDADLAELTSGVPWGPYQGQFSLNVDYARAAESVITDFKGRAQVTNLALNSFAPLLELETLAGQATLEFDSITLSRGHVQRFRASGIAMGLSVSQLLQKWGRGSATGDLKIRINNLDVRDDKIKSADIEIHAAPTDAPTGTIDRELLLGAVEKLFQFSWPSAIPKNILPERINYTQFGTRLLIRDNKLRILGTHGDEGDAILTIQVFGQPFSVVKEQPSSIDLTPWIEKALEKARGYSPDDLREWWEEKRPR